MSNLRRSIRSHIRFSLHIHLSLARSATNTMLVVIASFYTRFEFIHWMGWWCYKWGSIVAFLKIAHDIMRRWQREERKKMLCCTFLLRKVNYSLLYFEWKSAHHSRALSYALRNSFWVHLLIITSRRVCHVEFLKTFSVELGNDSKYCNVRHSL